MILTSDRFFAISKVVDNSIRAQKLFNVIQVFSQFQKETKIASIGDPFFTEQISLESIFNYLEHIERNRMDGIADPICFSSDNNGFNFFFDTQPGLVPYDYLWFTIDSPVFNLNDVNQLEKLVELFAAIYRQFESRYAYTENELLKSIYFAKSSYANAKKNIPLDLISFLPIPGFENLAKYDLPSLQTPQSINLFENPNGLWWINIFNERQINNIGKEKLFSINWFESKKIDESNYLFVLTESKLDCDNKEHLAKLKEALHKIDLDSMQIFF